MPSKKERIIFPSKSRPPWEGSVASLGYTTRKLGNGAVAQSTYLLMEAGRKGTKCRAGRCWSIQSTAVGEQNAQRGWWDPEEPPPNPPVAGVCTARKSRKGHRAGLGRGWVRGHNP